MIFDGQKPERINMAQKMNIDECRSYATEDKLLQGLRMKKLDRFEYLIVKNTQNRFTAIFPLGWNREAQPIWFAQAGFMVVG